MYVDWNERCETPAGAGQVRPHRSFATRMLTARLAESEHPGVEINHPKYLIQRNKVCGNSQN